MYIVEKIGDLILISIENDIMEKEIGLIKSKLAQLARVTKDDVVVSIYNSAENKNKSKKIEQEINNLLKYCNDLGLRVYSYQS